MRAGSWRHHLLVSDTPAPSPARRDGTEGRLRKHMVPIALALGSAAVAAFLLRPVPAYRLLLAAGIGVALGICMFAFEWTRRVRWRVASVWRLIVGGGAALVLWLTFGLECALVTHNSYWVGFFSAAWWTSAREQVVEAAAPPV